MCVSRSFMSVVGPFIDFGTFITSNKQAEQSGVGLIIGTGPTY